MRALGGSLVLLSGRHSLVRPSEKEKTGEGGNGKVTSRSQLRTSRSKVRILGTALESGNPELDIGLWRIHMGEPGERES